VVVDTLVDAGSSGVDPARPLPLGLRARAAVAAGNLTAAVSRASGMGAGSIIGGRVSLALDPHLLTRLTAGRGVVVVTGTNGKTTTAALIAAALGTAGRVASNTGGSNMLDGLVAALTRDRQAPHAVLEVDELHVPQVLDSVDPAVLVLLNLTRDQLDRVGEVAHLITTLRTALVRRPGCLVVANPDDPAVVAAVPDGARVVWVATGSSWEHDTVVCPRCAQVLTRSDGDWWCGCGLRRPVPDWRFDESGFTGPGGAHGPLVVALPGLFNRANATVALAVADAFGVSLGRSTTAVAAVVQVSGRYRQVRHRGHDVRLLLVKNPAGATEMLGVLAGGTSELVLVVNGREADGRDLSWVWDVPFEQLAGRRVTVAGERASDVAVRLGHAGVPHRVVHDPWAALAGLTEPTVDVLANYTAFRDLVRGLDRAR
jgi:UDP-N-acetylmuramyl tripeptide synthase